MQGPGSLQIEGATVPKSTKKKSSTQKVSKHETQENERKRANGVMRRQPTQTFQKVPKRSIKNEVPQMVQQPEKSTSDSLPDSSTDNEYRSLRRKYLLLEEESFGLGREMRDTQDAIEALEDEKVSLLDELVVLEGLVDPPEMDPTRRLP